MWLFRKRTWTQAGWIVGGLASVWGAWVGIAQIVSIDALGRFRNASYREDEGLALKGLTINSWFEDRKTATATAERMTMARDRSRLTLQKISKGELYPEDGPPIRFKADSADYEIYRRRLFSDKATRVYSKDYSLRTSRFAYEETPQLLNVPGAVVGTLGGGRIKAKSLKLNLRTGGITALGVVWIGDLQDPSGKPKKRKWQLEGDLQGNGDLRVYTNAKATDGEVIIKAPRIEHEVKTDVLTATGGIKYWGEEANIIAKKVVVYRKESKVIATGDVSMLLKAEKDKGLKEEEIPVIPITEPDKVAEGEPETAAQADADQKRLDDEVRSSGNLRKYPSAVRADEITYWYKEGQRRAIINGSPQARQELGQGRWRMVWAHSGDYDGEGDWLTLKSKNEESKDARLRSSLGDYFKAVEFVVSTKENDERMTAKKAEGITFVDEDETPNKGTTPPPPKVKRAASRTGR